MQLGRAERRTAVTVVARLESVSDPSSIEMAWIENISNQGARVITLRRWRVDDQLVLMSFAFRSAVARVIYCQPVTGDRYAIGIKFNDPIPEAVISTTFKGVDG